MRFQKRLFHQYLKTAKYDHNFRGVFKGLQYFEKLTNLDQKRTRRSVVWWAAIFLKYLKKNMSTIVTKFVSSSLNHVSMAFYVKLQKSFCIVERKEIKFPLCRFEMMCGRKRSIIRSWLLYLAISHTKVYRISDCLHLGRRCDPNSFHFHYLMIVNS